MKIKSMKCPSCDASLKIKPGTTEGVCEYCKTPYVIDDEVIRIEKKTTVELKTDNDLEIATATLDNFKEYGKSEFLFRRLVHRYGHKKEVYIGLVRSITHDFNRHITDTVVLMEVNSFWDKYKSLATKKEVAVYDEKIKELNKKHWYGKLVKATGNFNYKKSREDVVEIENIWDNYQQFCDEKEIAKVKYKYNDFLKKKKNDVSQKNRLIKLGLIIIIIIALIIFLLDYLSLSKEKTKQNVDAINASVLNENCDSLTHCEKTTFIEEYFKDTRSDLSVSKVSIDTENKLLKVTIKLENRYTSKESDYEFKINDDMGPFISSNNCVFKDTETVDVYACFEAYDFTDGEISNNNIEVDLSDVDFTIAETKKITVRAIDSEENTTSRTIPVEITKTEMDLKVSLDQNLVVGKTYKLSYSFEPNTIPNQEVEITYDESYVSIKDNIVTPLKKGETSICVVSKYDNTKECVDVSISLECKDTVVFNFNGGKKETIVAGENFCAGTYKVYASVSNASTAYRIEVIPKGSYSGESILIWKSASSLSDEGNKYALNEGTKLEIAMGITKVRLVKVS